MTSTSTEEVDFVILAKECAVELLQGGYKAVEVVALTGLTDDAVRWYAYCSLNDINTTFILTLVLVLQLGSRSDCEKKKKGLLRRKDASP